MSDKKNEENLTARTTITGIVSAEFKIFLVHRARARHQPISKFLALVLAEYFCWPEIKALPEQNPPGRPALINGEKIC